MSRRISPHPVDSAAPVASSVQQIPIKDIELSGSNPRRALDDIDELAASIRTYGLLQPVVVRKKGKKYELIAGHRRVAALQAIEWSEVPAIVRQESAERAYLLTLVENLQRDDLTPREEADALAELVRARNWSTHQVADAINRSQAYVSKRIRVFDDELLRPAVLAHRLTVSAAEELLALRPERRRVILEEAVAQGWDQARVRAAVREELGLTPRGRGAPRLRTQVEHLRKLLRGLRPAELSDTDRRALERLFMDLATVARAPHARVFPALPEVISTTRRMPRRRTR